MKPRRWLLALLLAPILLAAALITSWHAFDLDEEARRQVEGLLAMAGFREIQLESLQPAWIGLNLDGLSFQPPGAGATLYIDRLKLRLSPILWLRARGEALAALQSVDVDGIEALFENGVLTLTVPKAEEIRPKQIKVQVK